MVEVTLQGNSSGTEIGPDVSYVVAEILDEARGLIRRDKQHWLWRWHRCRFGTGK
jgi:hypothetical protein